MHRQRVTWFKEHLDWTVNIWDSVIFSNEMKFNLHRSGSKPYVRNRKGMVFNSDCMVQTVKFWVSQMVLGCISSKGDGRLHFINWSVNIQSYKTILSAQLIPTIQEQLGDTESCISQDNSAPCHSTWKVNKFSSVMSVQLVCQHYSHLTWYKMFLHQKFSTTEQSQLLKLTR